MRLALAFLYSSGSGFFLRRFCYCFTQQQNRFNRPRQGAGRRGGPSRGGGQSDVGKVPRAKGRQSVAILIEIFSYFSDLTTKPGIFFEVYENT